MGADYIDHSVYPDLDEPPSVLVLQRFPGLAPGAGERRCEQNPGHLPSLSQILAPIHDEFRRSGMSQEELETLLEGELAEHRRERGAAKDRA